MTKKKTDPAKAAAKAKLQRLREIEAAAATAEYHAGMAADLQNMAQLKALRLAKRPFAYLRHVKREALKRGKTATAIAPPMRKSESP